MVYTPNGVVLEGFPLDDTTFTYTLTGVARTDEAAAALAGKAVTQDTTADGAVKPAGDGDAIFGRVFLAENRQVQGFMTAAVQRRFKERLPADSGHGIARGDSVVGAGDGKVKKATAANGTVVIATGSDYVIVEKLG